MSVRSFRPPKGLLKRIRNRKRGLTLLEVAGALGIVAVAGVGFANMAAESQLATKDKATATRLKEVSDAAAAYIRANYPQIVAVAPLTIAPPARPKSTGLLCCLQPQGTPRNERVKA